MLYLRIPDDTTQESEQEVESGQDTLRYLCKNCNHECHCEGEHIDEYLDYCPCDNCECQSEEKQ